MKKYKNKNIVRGLPQYPPPLVVRWLGAYGHSSDIEEMARWELAPTRQVAAEALRGGASNIRQAKVGLLVDTNKTALIRAYCGDSATTRDSKLIATRDKKFVTDWQSVTALVDICRRSEEAYVECTLDSPVYTAVIVKNHESASVMAVAEKVAQIIGLDIAIIKEDVKK